MSDREDGKVYRLTPLGLFGVDLNDKILALMVKFGDNAIVLNEGKLEWAKVERAPQLVSGDSPK